MVTGRIDPRIVSSEDANTCQDDGRVDLLNPRHWKKPLGPGRVAIGCVAENNPEFLSRALNLLRSVRWFGGAMAGVDFFVCIADGVDSNYVREF